MKNPISGVALIVTFFFALGSIVFACAGGGDDDDDSAANDDDADDDDTSGEEVWTDPDTGLGWQNGEAVGADQITQSDANTYCQDLVWAGFDDWRLPTIGELRGLVRGCEDTATGGSCQVRDDCTSWHCYTVLCEGCADGEGPGADGAYWPAELTGNRGGYWSATSISDQAGTSWPADFDVAGIPFNDSSERGARCVRGAGSGIADDTGEAYRMSLVLWVGSLTPVNPPVVLQGAHCDLIDIDGVPVDESFSVRSDEYGWCAMVFNQPFESFTVKVSASGFQDVYVTHYRPFLRDAQGNEWGWIITMTTSDVSDAFAESVGITPDPAKGIVYGTVQWLPTIPDGSTGGASFVGCAEIAPTPDDFYYTDETGTPTDGLTETNPATAAFFAFNQDPGSMEWTATVDGQSASTGEFEVYPDSWTLVMPSFPEVDYPENPTPDGCL